MWRHRLLAILEVLICSDFPTQLAIGATFAAIGYAPYDASKRLQIGFIAGVSLIDAFVLVGLVLFFLRVHGESPRDVIFGSRPIASEAAHGIPLIFVAIAIGVAVLVTIMHFAPWLHPDGPNPLQEILRSPRDAWLFAVVVVVAGGLREEIQRAFLLHRFKVWLGGGGMGIVVTSVAFGAGHLVQGKDAAIATGLLGAFWGWVYLRRRSTAAPIVSHAGFDLVQIVQFVIAGR